MRKTNILLLAIPFAMVSTSSTADTIFGNKRLEEPDKTQPAYNQPRTWVVSRDTPPELADILKMKSSNFGNKEAAPDSEFKDLRGRELERAAYTYALQKGVEWRYKQINALVQSKAAELDAGFDFKRLIMSNGMMLPPVISEVKESLNIESSDYAISAQRTYNIIADARIIGGSPSWRDYLIHQYPATKELHQGILPRTEAERERWMQMAMNGWHDGIEQANYLNEIAVNRLKRDFSGMLKYRELVALGVVSEPILAQGRPGIVINGKRLEVDRKTFRITVPAEFERSEKWKAVVADPTMP